MNKTKVSLTCAASVAIIALAIVLGAADITFSEIIMTVRGYVFGYDIPEAHAASCAIIWSIRLPRVLLAFLVGSALGISGAAMQSTLQNPLASPYTMGVSSGASLGAGIVIVAGVSFFGRYTMSVAGVATGMIAVAAVIGFSAKIDKSLSNNTVILTGMVFSLFFSAVLTTISALAADDLKQVVLWQMGSFALKGYKYIAAFLPFLLVGVIALMFRAREMDIMTLGDSAAKSIGVSPKGMRKYVFVISSALVGAAVSVSGVIGFVDLIAPHTARKIFGSRHRLVLPMSALIGGCIMTMADLIARIVLEGAEIPVGAVTALIGTPFFAYVYLSRRKKHD